MESNETEDIELRWPRGGGHAFLEVHPLRGAWAATASDERLYRMIKGFMEAGDILVAEAEANPRRAQDLLYPIIFDYRQSLELRLKYLLMAYAPLVKEEPEYRTHDLAKLWAKTRRVVLTLHGPSDAETETFDAVDRLIAEFDAVDPGSDSFRFAHDTKGRPIALSVSAIDLANLRAVVAGLHNFLECVDLHLHHGCGVPRCGR